MPIFLITGLPGTGKSTINNELKQRGFISFDADEDNLAHWFDADGNVIDKKDELRTHEFLNNHSRDIHADTVLEISHNNPYKAVFICGDPQNEDDLEKFFTKVFALNLEEGIRQQRIRERSNNSWGKLIHEREYDLTFKDKALARYAREKYVVLDATRSTEKIVDKIISLI